jgi:hypothetical protein
MTNGPAPHLLPVGRGACAQSIGSFEKLRTNGLGTEIPPIATRRGGPPAPVRPKTARPTAGNLFEMRFAADTAHDFDAVDQSSYRWVKIDPRSHLSLDGLLARVENDKNQVVSVKLDRQNLTERDLLEVKQIVDQRGQPGISFLLTRDGAERFGALTRAHLPETEEAPRYRLAIIVQGSVVSMPVINAEIRDTGIIEFGPDVPPVEIDRLARLFAEAAAYNAPAPTAKAVRDYAEAISEAAAVDLPALAMANRISIESATSGSRLIVTSPKPVESVWRALRPRRAAPGMGVLAATLSFFRDDELIRKVWVNEGGEWGFERPGTSWTTGSDAELWRLVKPRLIK